MEQMTADEMKAIVERLAWTDGSLNDERDSNPRSHGKNVRMMSFSTAGVRAIVLPYIANTDNGGYPVSLIAAVPVKQLQIERLISFVFFIPLSRSSSSPG